MTATIIVMGAFAFFVLLSVNEIFRDRNRTRIRVAELELKTAEKQAEAARYHMLGAQHELRAAELLSHRDKLTDQ